jgi:PAS domain S-box-containing protein
VQGLFRAADRVNAEHFDSYVDALLAGSDFTGIQLLGFVAMASGEPAAAARVEYVAPATGLNLKALGTDPYADPVRRAGMLLARDSGGIAITPRVGLPSEAGQGEAAGFLMFLPVYATGKSLANVEARRAAFSGWVFASIRMSDLMSSLYGEGVPGIDVRVHDGVGKDPRTLMYRSNRDDAAGAAAHFEAQEYIGFAGHTWTLVVTAQPAFEEHRGADATRVIAIAGIGVSVLLALLARQLISGRARAYDAATAMTQELRASEERYRRIVDTADEGIWTTDGQGRISFVNPTMARLLGRRPADMLGRGLADFADDAVNVADATRGSAAGPSGVGARHEAAFRRADGSPLWVSMTTTTILDTAGQHAGTLGMVTDITERKRADTTRTQLEAQLRESQKMLAIGTLAGGIAHDFNNILAGILGNVSLAQHAAGAGHPALASLEQISKAAVRARSLVQQILAFSRRQPHQLIRQPLRPLIEDAVHLLRPILPSLAELEVRLAETALHVDADAAQIEQVVMNLCTNAWHALRGGAGRITIGLDSVALDAESALSLGGLAPGSFAHLWVGDNGCGMDEATLARVFEPFFTTKAVGHGTGLGLSVVHGIVATHHGAITARSALGEGSRFDLYFPLGEPQVTTASAHGSAPAAQPSPGQHVLYVDDDPIMVLMVQALLERSGYRVTSFENPREAVAALRADPQDFDLVVTDFNMPGLSGLDVARELAEIRPDLPVVISSGYVSDEMQAAAVQLGVRHVLQKEYTLERLADVLQRILGERSHA